MTGTRLISSGLSSSIARLRSAPRPAKRVAELGQVALRGRARLRVERAEDLVELDRLRRALRSGIVAPSSKPSLDVPLRDLDVLQARAPSAGG